MKKKLILLPLLIMLVVLAACSSKTKLTDFEQFVEYILQSEQKLNGYNETYQLSDASGVVYSKITDFELERGSVVSSSVTTQELKKTNAGELSSTTTAYTTVGNVKYIKVSGTLYEVAYTLPTYYLTFVMNEDYLNEGYSLSIENNTYTLEASIKDDMISSFFLEKSVSGIKNLNIEVIVADGKLASYNAKFVLEGDKYDFNVDLTTSYSYPISYSTENDYINAIFYLEGGICGNTHERILHSYDFKGKKEMKIYDHNKVVEGNITKAGYHIEGWYQNKEVVDGETIYTNKWDFTNDKMTRAGVTLYAKWEENIVYSYNVCYYDAEGNRKVIGSYNVQAGDTFDDYLNYYKKVSGYTALGYLDSEGNKWDESFKHPGGEESLAIDVYLDLMEGSYQIISTFAELKKNKTKNIYLASDIDLEGESFNFGKYKNTFLGNNHKISNFTVNYDASRNGLVADVTGEDSSQSYLYISIFTELDKAQIKNVTFENVLYDVNTTYSKTKGIVVAPLTSVANDSVIENVKVTGKYTITKTPEGVEPLFINELVYFGEGNNVINSTWISQEN